MCRSRRGVVRYRRINAQRNPRDGTITYVVPKQQVLEEGNHSLRHLIQNSVLAVRSHCDSAGGIRLSRPDLAAEFFVAEELSGVRGGNGGNCANEWTVRADGSVVEVVGHDVDMYGTADDVMAGKDCLKLHNTGRAAEPTS